MKARSKAARVAIGAAIGAAAFGCQGEVAPDETGATGSSLVSGLTVAESFPQAPAQVRAVSGEKVVVAPVDDAGRFTIEVPEARGWRLELLGESRTYPVAWPRSETEADETFDVLHETTAFNLGRVRWATDLADRPPVVVNAGIPDDARPRCMWGLEETTGRLCVDDEQATTDACGPELDESDEALCEAEACAEVAARPMPAEAAVPERALPPRLGCSE